MSDRPLTKIIWHDWYPDADLAKIKEFGTLEVTETMVDVRLLNGDEVAAEIAEDAYSHDSECFRNGGRIVILQPLEFAGDYTIQVHYEPVFNAHENAVHGDERQ